MPYADIEKQRSHHRDYQKSPEGFAAHARAVKVWRTRNKKRLAAHNAVSKALVSGKLVRAIWCSMPRCKDQTLEAHHPDYDRPLDVVWLCNKHHREAHAMVKEFE